MSKTVDLSPFLGINNRVPDESLARVERGRRVGNYLRNAVNVDITNAGTLKRRTGRERRVECSDAHSLWGMNSEETYYVDGTTLYLYPRTQVRTGLTRGMRVSFAADPRGGAIWSNGVEIGRVVGGQSSPLGISAPNPAPSVSAGSGGGLPAGKYMVAVCSESSAGEQSAPAGPYQIDVPQGGRITVSGLGGRSAVYMSPQNGDELYRVATASSSHTIHSLPTFGAVCSTLGLQSMPPGQIVRWHNGRLLVASGSMLYVSEPYAPALFNPLRGFIPLPDRITVLEPCGDGVFIATREATYRLSGADALDSQLSDLLPYGAVEGTAKKSPWMKSVAWFSSNGLVIGSEDGSISNPQEDNVAVGSAEYGATLYRESDGMSQVVCALFQSGPMRAADKKFIRDESQRQEHML